MQSNQIWHINGQAYNHGQLMEMRRQKLEPLTDKPVLADVTPRKKKAKKVAEVAPEVQAPEVPVEAPVEPVEVELPFAELKALAKEKGMEVSNSTKKVEVKAFLEANK